MRITILTLFPEMFSGPFGHSIIKRAQEKQLVEIRIINIRDFGQGAHKIVDDKPYGGGLGMILKVDVLDQAIQFAKDPHLDKNEERVVLMDARGKTFTQTVAKEFSKFSHLILVCGHYEGVDERISHFIDEKISVGEFVVTGGEIPAMAITDAVIRLIKGVLKEGVTENESFSKEEKYIEHPHYTRPPSYKGHDVPEILISGHHEKIQNWKEEKSS